MNSNKVLTCPYCGANSCHLHLNVEAEVQLNLDVNGYIDSIASTLDDIKETWRPLNYADIYCDQCHKFSLAMFDDNYFPDQVVDVLPPEEYK